MNVYLLRHGTAEDGTPDADRRLTAKGREGLRRVLAAAGVAPDVILTSPLRRATESAEIASEVLGCRRVVESSHLLPSAEPAELWKELAALQSAQDVLVVGHEPHLSAFLAFLLGSSLNVDFKKGALARVAIDKRSGSPNGVLKWLLTPKLAK